MFSLSFSLTYIHPSVSSLPCAASLLCIVTRLLISVLLHHRWEGCGWYIRALSARILVIFNDNNNNNNKTCLILFT